MRERSKKRIWYTTTMFRCVSCSSDEFHLYRNINGYALNLCAKCGLLQTGASEEEIKKYVREKYSKKYTDDYAEALPKLYRRFTKQMLLIQRYKSGGKLLDVGCGTGHFLKFLKNRYPSWETFGVEPSDLLRKFAIQNTGSSIKNGKLHKIPFADEYFDVITCYDVLEHSVDLKKNILELKRVLKPDGLLFIQAPNYKSAMARLTGNRWDWWCIPDHVLHFSYDFLRTYVRKNGFTILENYTYEDQEDYLRNIKGIFSKNYLTKVVFYFLVPFFLIIEQIARVTHNGGLTVVVAGK